MIAVSGFTILMILAHPATPAVIQFSSASDTTGGEPGLAIDGSPQTHFQSDAKNGEQSLTLTLSTPQVVTAVTIVNV